MNEAQRKLAQIVRQILLDNPRATGTLKVNLHEGSVSDRYSFEKTEKVKAG